MIEDVLKTNDQIKCKQDLQKDPCAEHLRLCVDWCADNLIFLNVAVSSIEEGIEKASDYLEFGGDIFIFKSVSVEIVHWIQKKSNTLSVSSI